MANNYFFTGEKGIGKSTIINALCDKFGFKTGGFKTIKNVNDDKSESFHIINISKNEIPNKENLLFYRCKNKNEEDIISKFNKFSDALDDYIEYDIIIMDEIGPNENKAEIFKKKILEILDSDKFVIGVLQEADTDFINQIKNRKDTKIFTVTNENRNIIKEIILGIKNEESKQ